MKTTILFKVRKTAKGLLPVYLFALIPLFASCNDWLDVRPDTEQKEDGQFATEKGFQTALTGCYIQMASSSAYGMQLTMSSVECLANLWYLPSTTRRYAERDLSNHNYTSDYAKSAMSNIYTTLFKTVAQANLIIKNAEENPGVFTEKRMYDIVLGEAYAIRAYCQLDILRLFGQMPQNGSRQVKLPYSETTNIDAMPAYYGFAEYAAKLKTDIEKAEQLLKNSDPAMQYPFNRTYATNEVYEHNSYLMYRQMRLNYWAVRALHARMALYVGDKQSALTIARELIGAHLPDGTAVRPLSGQKDFKAGYLACPNECYFSMSKYDIQTLATAYFSDNVERIIGTYNPESHLALTNTMLEELFDGENTNSHNRYTNLWNPRLKDSSSALWCGFMRYCYDEETVTNPSIYYQIIPMLRTSEMYLIVMETSSDLTEVNSLYREYMIEHDVANMPEFASLADAHAWILNEYRREFYGEGQMFFTYKRMGATSIKWLKTPADENTYIIPLPETEYDPGI